MVGATRPSLRNGLTAYSALSPGTGLDCPRRRAKPGFAQLGTSVGVSGPHGFAVRGRLLQGHATGLVPVRHSFGESGSASLVLRHRVHRIPHSTSVTIAKRPSDERGTARANHTFPKNGMTIFFAPRTGQWNQR
jgi:hypothetical protein